MVVLFSSRSPYGAVVKINLPNMYFTMKYLEFAPNPFKGKLFIKNLNSSQANWMYIYKLHRPFATEN